MPQVKFFAGLRSIAGTKETSVSADSVRRLLDVLVDTYPPLEDKLWDGETIRPHVVISDLRMEGMDGFLETKHVSLALGELR